MKISITSNDGWDKVDLETDDDISRSGDDLVKCKITYSSTFWDRHQVVALQPFNLVADKSITLLQVVFTASKWSALVANLRSWVGHHDNLFSLELSDSNGQRIAIGLYVDDEMISSSRKPVFRMSVNDSRTKIAFQTVIDHTSIQIN